MRTRKIVVNKICVLNADTIAAKETRKIIRYLDTGNITRNKIVNIQLLDGSKEPLPSRAQRKVKNNTIIYSTVRPNQEHFGHLENPEENLIVSTGFLTIDVIDESVDPKFLYYSLTRKNITDYLQTIAVNNVSSYPSLNPDDMGKLELDIPKEKEEQQKIANVISAMEDKIELNNKVNGELETMAKLIYDYWFVQYEFPNEKGKPYKTSGGKMVWNETLKRKIPVGWKVLKISDELHTSLGGTPSTKKKEYWEKGNVNWLNSGEVANFPVITSELKITQDAIENSATELMPKGTTLLSITRHLRPTILGIDACANQSVVGIMESDEVKCFFIYPYLKNEISRYLRWRTGAQQPHINKDTVDESPIVLPENVSNIMKSYNRIVEPMYDQIFNIAYQNQKLMELRDWLLPMLMNGQVKVS